MKNSRFTDSQIMDALNRAEAGIKVPDLCRELGISSALLLLARQVWRNGCLDGIADEGVGRRESAAAEDGR